MAEHSGLVRRGAASAWIVVGGLALLGAAGIVGARHLLGVLWHPAVVLASLGALALGTGWVRDGGWRLCLLVGLDVIAAVGVAFHVVASWARWTLADAATRWLSWLVALHLLPGVWLHLRAWTMVSSDWSLHVWSASNAQAVRSALTAPRDGRDKVFVATSVRDGDAVGEIRDAAGARPAVVRVEQLGARFATTPLHVPASFLLGGMTLVEERSPTHGYRGQQSHTRIASFDASQYVGRDPERAAVGTSYLGDVARALLLVIVQHVVLPLLALVLAAVIAGLIDAWT